jgi:hypothetical protein
MRIKNTFCLSAVLLLAGLAVVAIPVALKTVSPTRASRHKGSLLPALLRVRAGMVLVAGDTQYFQIEANCATTLVPRNNMICLTLVPVQLLRFKA